MADLNKMFGHLEQSQWRHQAEQLCADTDHVCSSIQPATLLLRYWKDALKAQRERDEANVVGGGGGGVEAGNEENDQPLDQQQEEGEVGQKTERQHFDLLTPHLTMLNTLNNTQNCFYEFTILQQTPFFISLSLRFLHECI
jgi:hypothetical protein